MFRIKLEAKARPQSPVPRERTLDPLGREPVFPQYKPRWMVDADEEFMIETAAMELEETDALSAETRHGDAFFAWSGGDTFGAIVPHLPIFVAFLVKKKSDSVGLSSYEDGLFLTFLFRRESLLTRGQPGQWCKMSPDEVSEENVDRLVVEVCKGLHIFVTAVQDHLPHLYRRREYQVWLNSADSAACIKFCSEQGMLVKDSRP